jgi:hypothetical protein
VTSTLFVDPPAQLDDDLKSNAFWSKHGRLARRLILVIVAALLLFTWLVLRPRVDTYNVAVNSPTWATDVQVALSKSGTGGPVAPTGSLSSLPGVGKISRILVEHTIARKGTVVYFWSAAKPRGSALEYLIRVPPASDQCNIHLTGPWWQMAPLNDRTMSCPRGFTFTPGP